MPEFWAIIITGAVIAVLAWAVLLLMARFFAGEWGEAAIIATWMVGIGVAACIALFGAGHLLNFVWGSVVK